LKKGRKLYIYINNTTSKGQTYIEGYVQKIKCNKRTLGGEGFKMLTP
jgi:hypothetical protein